MTKTLELIFVNMAGEKVALRVTDPRDNLQESKVRAVMYQIVAKDVFTSSGGSPPFFITVNLHVIYSFTC